VTYQQSFQPGPRPGPSGGGFRPGAPGPGVADLSGTSGGASAGAEPGRMVTETGHPAVDAVLQALVNAARLAPSEQIAEYEAAHQVFQETLAGIDR
jgi:hypothetical protein